MLKLETPFALGDIIEFKDSHFGDGGKWVDHDDQTYVDRIRSIHFIVGYANENHPIEIWCDMYNELPGRMYTWPERIVRTIEHSNRLKTSLELEPPIAIGAQVIYEDMLPGKKNERRQFLDEVEGYDEVTEKGICWQFKMKAAGYLFDREDLEVR